MFIRIVLLLCLFLFLATLSVFALSLTLVWDSNTEPDLLSYSVHYGQVSRDTATLPNECHYRQRIDHVTGTTYESTDLDSSKTYYFAVTAVDSSANRSAYSNEVSNAIGIEQQERIYLYTSFKGSRPNPLQHSARFDYELGQKTQVKLRIYNCRGKLVRELNHGVQGPGAYTLAWDLRDQRGMIMAAGTYIAELVLGKQRKIGKLTINR